ncbi:LLM class flavin-dependent oxidoreductase [Mammaliicoccus sp. Dog046]|uniref:LLM class flavin-dependent oxidoreductase n=1 Tax=Mammaliicoccus sp. Dog046 TaxID=3034233 RepID=UPI002B25E12D|nr:LLM class flavin-dependent oxidoreductase [Mammaliicoccus sp. Dog046]WQK85786.1 LLM class flavin-dependent oxidoreductase [Mammaliicoccus sp. Dog046]
MKLSVLDQAPISKGNSPETTLQHTIELAQFTEQLGYHRFWVAEHHNTSGLAISSPEILMTRIAASTNRIRVGSGGILLPQYSPYKIAENAKTLTALFPSRIDIGIGNSPGGSPITQKALTDNHIKPIDDFYRQVSDLQGFMHNTLPRDHDYRLVKASPRIEQPPKLWLLGLTENGAKNAANLGIGFVFGHFINSKYSKIAMKTYYEQFKPSVSQTSPSTIVCIFVVCAETDEQAEALAVTQDKWLLNISKGLGTQVQPPSEINRDNYSNDDLEIIKKNRERCIIGSPNTVKSQLQRLSEQYQTDEFMIITNIYDFAAKQKSYQLLAEVMEIED